MYVPVAGPVFLMINYIRKTGQCNIQQQCRRYKGDTYDNYSHMIPPEDAYLTAPSVFSMHRRALRGNKDSGGRIKIL